MAIGEAESADQTDALALGAGEAVADDERSPDGAAEDVGRAVESRRRLGKPYRSHRSRAAPRTNELCLVAAANGGDSCSFSLPIFRRNGSSPHRLRARSPASRCSATGSVLFGSDRTAQKIDSEISSLESV